MPEDDDQWRYSVEDFPDDGPGETAPAASTDPGESEADAGDADETERESGGNVAGQIGGLDDDLEPGTPTVENTFFVLLGVTATVLFFMVVVGVI